MRTSRLLRGFSILLLLFCGVASFAQTPPPNAIPLISQVTPPSVAPPPTSSQIVQFSLTILGANFPSNAVVKLTIPQGPSFYAGSVSVNSTGTQIVAQFNTTLPGASVYAVTVANAVSNPTRVSNPYYLPITPSAPTVGISHNTSGFLSGAPSAMTTGDFNRDGVLDIAVVSQTTNTVSILNGEIGGVFTAGASYPTGNTPSGIVAADFNGDGVLDLAYTNAGDNTVTILLGNGDGTFRAGTTISDPGVYPTQIVAADLNGDGVMDLAVLNVCGPGPVTCYPQAAPQGPGSVTVLLGNGDGTFSVSASSPATGNVPSAIAAADLNADGFIDLIVANRNDNNVTLLMGNGDGTFTPAQSTVATGMGPSAIAIGDFNLDGKLDLAVTNSSDNTVSILLSQNCGLPATTCTFSAAPVSPEVGVSPSAIATGDMNADGFVDLVVTNENSNTVTVLLGNGTGGFSAVTGQPAGSFSTGATPQALALADFNQDGRLDIVTVNGSGSYSLLITEAVAQVVLTSSNTAASYGAPLTFTAQVNPSFGAQPTGTVTLFDGTNSLGTVSLSGYQANFFSFPLLSVGTHQITATYNGDSNFLASTSAAVTETISQAQTNLTLSSNVNTVAFGQPFTLSATVQISNLGTPTGTVSFFDTSTSTSLGTATVANGVAQLTLSNLAPGAHVITASYGGDANFTGSSSPTYTENITQATTTTTVTSSLNPMALGQTPTFTATIQPSASTAATGFAVFYSDGTSLGAAPVMNNVAQFHSPTLPVGTHAITAQYTGDTNYTASTSNPIPETVNRAFDTVSLSMNPNPSAYGQAVTFSVTVQPIYYSGTPTGTVIFADGSTNLGIATLSNGTAQFMISTLTAGSHPITATYNGDSNFQQTMSLQITENIVQAVSTTVTTSSQNPSSYSQPVTLTASVQPQYGGTATGSVSFFDGSLLLGTATLSGNAAAISVSNLAVGTQHSITARYAGDSNVSASTSAPISQTVNPSATTITITSNANPSTYGQNVTIAASVKAAFGILPSSTISFYDGTTLLGTINMAAGPSQVTTNLLTGGTHSITAVYAGNANYTSSTSAALTQTVNPVSTTTYAASNVNPSTYGQLVNLSAAITTPNNLVSGSAQVTFYDNGVSIGTANLQGNSATLPISTLTVGAHSITASFAGDSNLSPSTSTAITQTVNGGLTTLTIALSSYSTTYGQAITMTSNVKPVYGGTPTGTVTFWLNSTTSLGTGTLVNGTAQATTTAVPAGSRSIYATYNGDTNFASSSCLPTQLTVAQATTTTVAVADVNPVNYAQTVTLSATVQSNAGSPTGSVTFLDGTSTLGTVTLASGAAQLAVPNLNGGSHSITAKYSGDSNFSTSTSAALTETVNPLPSISTIASNLNPATAGQAVTLTATVQTSSGISGTGIVFFLDGSTTLGTATLASGSAQFTTSTLAPGTHTLTVLYNGNGNLTGSTSTALTETVNQITTTTAVASSLNPALAGASVTFTATIQAGTGNSATGTVTFLDGSTTLGTATVASNSAQFATSTLTAGAHTISAVYGGSTNFAGSTSAALTETVNLITTTTALTSSANPALAGQAVTFTAAVQPGAGNTATGTVTFFDGSTSLGTATLTSNAAQLTLSSLAPGSHTITAVYGGSATFAGSTSAALSETVNQSPTTVTVTSSLNPATFGQSPTFVATVQPASGGTVTGTISFYDGTSLILTSNIVNVGSQHNMVQLTDGLLGGTHSITAVYSGDANDVGSTSSVLTETVNPASSTTSVAASANPVTFGQAVTLTASVTPSISGDLAIGTVTFFDGTTSLGTVSLSSNDSAQLSVSNLGAGSHSITAVYNGSANFATSTSAALTETVNQSATTISVTSSANPALAGASVTFAATVQAGAGNSATGTVTFLDGSTTLGTATLASNSAQLSVSTFAVGTHTITAVYGGSANFGGSTSAALTETVNQSSTTTTLVSNLNPATFGQAVPFVATVQTASGAAATGTVTFYDGTTSLGTATVTNNGSQHTAQFTMAGFTGGTHSITAAYGGDANDAASTSSALTETVNAASSTVSVAASANPATFGQTVTLTASVVPSISGDQATGTVTFFDGTTSLGTATLSSNSAQISVSNLSAGSHSITAKYAGDANFAASTSSALTETVNAASTSVTVSSGLNPAAYGQAVTLTATVQPPSGITASGSVTFMDGSTSLGVVTLGGSGSAQLSVSSFAVGAHSITAVYGGNANLSGSTSAVLTETVNDASTSVTVSSGLNPAAYGQAVTLTATVQPPSGITASGSVTFMDGATSLGVVTLNGSGSAQLSVSNFTVGAHSITAVYGGNANLSGSTSAVLTETVNQASSLVSVSAGANPVTYGQGVTFTATVSPAFAGSPTGTVTFLDGGTQLGSSAISGGAAQFSVGATTLIAGAHSITARYGGDVNFVGSTSSAIAKTVNPAATATVVTSSANPSVVGSSVTFTASVSSSVAGTQSGTVSFYLDGSSTATASVALSSGTAQFSTSSLGVGSHSVVVVFASSNANFAGSTSSALTQAISDFSIAISPSSLTVARNSSGTYTLTLTSLSGYNGTVSLSCSGAPTNTTCGISPTQVTLSGSGSAQATVTITVNRHASTGSHTLTFTGTSGTLTHKTMATLTVN